MRLITISLEAVLSLALLGPFLTLAQRDPDISNHEEFETDPLDESGDPVFKYHKQSSNRRRTANQVIYSSPKTCKKIQFIRTNKGAKTSNEASWSDFMDVYYFNSGYEVSRWAADNELTEDDDYAPWYLSITVFLFSTLLFLVMVCSGLVAPFLSYVLFHGCWALWKGITSQVFINFARRLWTKNEIQKRKQVLAIYMWARRTPKIRSQLPWFLRTNPDEDVPTELKELIPDSSSAESSLADDNIDYYYEGFESDNNHAIINEQQKLQIESERQPIIMNKNIQKILNAKLDSKELNESQPEAKKAKAPWGIKKSSEPTSSLQSESNFQGGSTHQSHQSTTSHKKSNESTSTDLLAMKK